MKVPEPLQEGLALVLVGSFNPAIFHPSWLALNQLIRTGEAAEAELHVSHPDYTEFKTEWFQLEVDQKRFVIRASSPAHYDLICDLFVGIFRLLRHTPCEALGINFEFHFPTASEEEWHRIGDVLAPKGIWSTFLKEPRLRRLSLQAERPDSHRGNLNVTVGPSRSIPQGIHIHINDHLIFSGTQQLLELIPAVWEPSRERSNTIPRKLLENT